LRPLQKLPSGQMMPQPPQFDPELIDTHLPLQQRLPDVPQAVPSAFVACVQLPDPSQVAVVHCSPSSGHAVPDWTLTSVQLEVPLQMRVTQALLVHVTAVP
jgi:hypothetical protein